MRAVLGLRLSNTTDNSTSIPRQRTSTTGWCRSKHAEIAGEAVDLDVSASKTSPFDRPELSEWLSRPAEYDALVFWRFDRAIRSMADMYELGKWAREHGKLIVFVEGIGGAPLELDMRTANPVSELILMILAFAAQMESLAISERVTGSQAHLRTIGRWHGGRYPYGWAAIENPKGQGYVLTECPETGPVVRRMIKDVIGGKSLYALANELNEEGVRTARDLEHHRMRGTWPENQGIWSRTAVSEILRSERLRGYVLHDENNKPKTGEKRPKWAGKPVIGPDGHPRKDRPALISDEDWRKLSAVMALKMRPETRIVSADSLLLRVLYCHGVNKDGTVCGHPMYGSSKKSNGKTDKTSLYRTYRCKARGTGHSVTVRADIVEKWATDRFLYALGPTGLRVKVAVAAEDHTAELERVRESIARLREDRKLGLFVGEEDEREFRRMMSELLSERDRLSALPSRPAGVEYVETGRTIEHAWNDAESVAERRQMMLDAGFRIYVRQGGRSGPKFDYSRLSLEITDEFFSAAADAGLALRTEQEAEDAQG